MHLTVLNDLAEAMKALDGKKGLRPGIRYGRHTTRVASGIHPQHNHTGIPDQWNKERTHWQ